MCAGVRMNVGVMREKERQRQTEECVCVCACVNYVHTSSLLLMSALLTCNCDFRAEVFSGVDARLTAAASSVSNAAAEWDD